MSSWRPSLTASGTQEGGVYKRLARVGRRTSRAGGLYAVRKRENRAKCMAFCPVFDHVAFKRGVEEKISFW